MTTTNGPVVFVGSATWDTIALVERPPAADERIVAEEIRCAGGGPAATAAVAAARLGLAGVCFVGVVGDDDDGDRILGSLTNEGVDVTHVIRQPGVQSGVSVVTVESHGGARSIVNRPSPRCDLTGASGAADLVRSASWVHADHVGWTSVAELLAPADRSAVVPALSVDGGNPIPGYRPAGVALDVPTELALVARYGSRPLDELLDRALADGARTVVATRGSEGSVAAAADGTRASAPGVRVEVRSTLGAGDVFHGALLAAVVRGEPLAHCLRYANAVAALSCRGLDGRSRIPTHDEALGALATVSVEPPSTQIPTTTSRS